MWFQALHFLRGIAAIAVGVLHCYWTWTLYGNIVVRHLYLCVDLFFIMSGFVISHGYLFKVQNGMSFWSFFSKRFSRLAIHYYLSGFVWVLASIIFFKGERNNDIVKNAVEYIFYIQIFSDSKDKINPVAWSVNSEIFSYALFYIFSSRLKFNIHKILLAASFFLLLLEFFYFHDLNIVSGFRAIIRSVTGFAIGAALQQVTFDINSKLCQKIFLTIQLLSAFMALYKLDFIVYPVSSAIIYILIKISRGPTKYDAFFRLVGDLSYPLYMWHFLISVIFGKLIYKLSKESVYLEGERFVFVHSVVGDLFLFTYLLIIIILAYIVYRLELILRKDFKKIL